MDRDTQKDRIVAHSENANRQHADQTSWTVLLLQGRLFRRTVESGTLSNLSLRRILAKIAQGTAAGAGKTGQCKVFQYPSHGF